MRQIAMLLVLAAIVGLLASKWRGQEEKAAAPAMQVAATSSAVSAQVPPPPPPVSAPKSADAVRRVVLEAVTRYAPTPAPAPQTAPAPQAAPVPQTAPAPQAAPVPQTAPVPAAPRAAAAPRSHGPILLEVNTVAVPASEADAASAPAPQAPSTAPGDPAMVARLEAIGELLKQGRRLEARQLLTAIYLDARGPFATKMRDVLDSVNAELVFNPACTDGATVHVIESGDNFTKIGRQYGVNYRSIARVNNMDLDGVLRVGRKLKVLTGKPSVLVVKGEFRLALLLDGAYIKEYPIGIGKDSPTPSGTFEVDSMEIHAPWNPPGGGLIRYGEEGYLLGERWIGFIDLPGASGLGIHGTNDEASIGTKCSMGCVRMKNADVVELYDFLQMGTQVVIQE